jgi:nucleotide-binding universal stress UspA family protein
MGEHLKKHFKAQGREPAHYVETAGKFFNIAFEEVFLEVNPADEMRILQKNGIDLIVIVTFERPVSSGYYWECSRKCFRHSKASVFVVRG